MGPNKILQQIKTCTDPPFIYKGPVDGTVQVFDGKQYCNLQQNLHGFGERVAQVHSKICPGQCKQGLSHKVQVIVL